MTRAIALWLLLAVVLLAGALLARRRGVGATRFLSAWVLASALLWACAGLFGYAGARVAAASDARAGIAVGTPLGALLGAPLGIALSDRRDVKLLKVLAASAVLCAVGSMTSESTCAAICSRCSSWRWPAFRGVWAGRWAVVGSC